MMILDSQKHPNHTPSHTMPDWNRRSVYQTRQFAEERKRRATKNVQLPEDCCELRASRPQAFLRLRSAQYFFIRSETALRAAADIRDRRRRRRVAAGVPVAALAFARPRPPRNRSGNARRMAASSRRSSSSRARAPSRARRCNSCRLRSATKPPLLRRVKRPYRPER
jgi:hypothetical protein